MNGNPVPAQVGESVLSVLFAIGERAISRTNHGELAGAYCGMGVCFCCTVSIDGLEKQRACQTLVRDGMQILTCRNRNWPTDD